MSHQTSVYLFGGDQRHRRSLSTQLAKYGSEVLPFDKEAEFVAFLEYSQAGTIIIIAGSSPTNALRLLSNIRARGIEWPVVVASSANRIATAVEAMQRGALDFVQLPVADAALQSMLLMANGQLDRLTPAVEGRRRAQERLDSLTPRERDILRRLQTGGLNKIIAYQLGISVRTVEAHRANIMAKLGVRNFAEAIMLIARAPSSIGADAAFACSQAVSAPGRAPMHAGRAPEAANLNQASLLRA